MREREGEPGMEWRRVKFGRYGLLTLEGIWLTSEDGLLTWKVSFVIFVRYSWRTLGGIFFVNFGGYDLFLWGLWFVRCASP